LFIQIKSELNSSVQIALASIRLIKKLVGESKWQTANDLLVILKLKGNELFKLLPSEVVLKNIWKRVLKIIKDESINEEYNHRSPMDSLQGNLFAAKKFQTLQITDSELKPIMIEAISEIINEIETSNHNIASQSLQHIHENEVILTMGKSSTVLDFLKNAARKRKFHVVVVENAPYLDGHEVALNLSKTGLEVTLISDAAIFSIISRVNKIIIGTHSIYANGGLNAHVGTNTLALAAKHHNIPVIVCSSLFKLSPEYYADSNHKLPDLLPSDDVLEMNFHPNVTVLNPKFDYVPPELINLFIFNTAENAPSYVYRLLREMYTIDEDCI
jgi:translation initiation factor eIF-2B subunit beta